MVVFYLPKLCGAQMTGRHDTNAIKTYISILVSLTDIHAHIFAVFSKKKKTLSYSWGMKQIYSRNFKS